MSKIFAFIVTFPLAFILFVKSVAFFDYDIKERYLQNATDLLAYKVKITGVLTTADLDEYKSKAAALLNTTQDKLSVQYSSGCDSGSGIAWNSYTLGSQLTKGYYFKVYLEDANVTLYSKVQNFGIDTSNPGNNLKHKAKSVVRVEFYE